MRPARPKTTSRCSIERFGKRPEASESPTTRSFFVKSPFLTLLHTSMDTPSRLAELEPNLSLEIEMRTT